MVCKFSMQDAMSVARNILKNPKLLPGGGATELTVSATLKQRVLQLKAWKRYCSVTVDYLYWILTVV